MAKREPKIEVTPTGHYINPADEQVLNTLPSDLDKRNAYLDGDDDTPPPDDATPPGEGEAGAGGEGAGEGEGAGDSEGGTVDQQANGEAGETDEARAAREAQEAEEASRQAAEEAATAAKANEQQQAEATAPAPAPSASTLNFKTRSPQEMAAAEEALQAKKHEAFKKYSDGEMSAEDFAKVDTEVMRGLMGLASELALYQAAQQSAEQAAKTALERVRGAAKTEGLIDYEKDNDAKTEFNAAVEMLSKLPSTANLDDHAFYQRAHSIVLANRGLSAKPAAAAPAAPAPQPPNRKAPAAPPTLRGVPNAATANVNGGVEEELSRLAATNPLEFQRRIGAMPKAQRDAYLDS